MAAISGVNIAMLPEEHAEFWAFLETTGDVWACWLGHDPKNVQYEPAPPATFLKHFAKKIQNYDCVDIYLGLKDAVLKPRMCTYTVTVGGKQVRQTAIDHAACELVRYGYGVINDDNVMSRTTASYYTSYLVGNEFKKQRPEFVKWGRKVGGWLKKRIAGEVPVHRCNYSIPATALTIRAVKKGLKVV